MFPIKLERIADIINGFPYGNKKLMIKGISSVNNMKPYHISFLFDNKFLKDIKLCTTTAVVLPNKKFLTYNTTAIIVNDPKLAFIKLANLFQLHQIKQAKSVYVSINNKVAIGVNVFIGSNSVIESNVTLSDNVVIGAGCFIGRNVKIGDGTILFANVTIHHNVVIGSKCIIQSGTVIGSDGFGYISRDNKWIKMPHLGSVTICNNVQIGSCTSIDRGTIDNTYIGDGTIIDNQCHIAHNVMIGNNTAIAGGVIIAGSAKIGSECNIGGASVINGHITICNGTTITGMSMVTKSILKHGIYSSGMPARKNKNWKKTTAILLNIDKLKRRLKNIEHTII